MGEVRYSVVLAPSADKQLKKLPRDAQRRIVLALEKLADAPRPRGAVKLAGEDELWRIRVGTYRAVYTIDDEKLVVLMLRIAHRKDAYRG